LTAEPNLASTNLPLDADRLWNDVMALAEITDPERAAVVLQDVGSVIAA
jgi:hypothetical protein